MQVEIRADRKSMVVRGYVNVVGRDSRVLHDKQGPYIEQIMPGAFAKALSAGAPVELRWDHKKTLGSNECHLSASLHSQSGRAGTPGGQHRPAGPRGSDR